MSCDSLNRRVSWPALLPWLVAVFFYLVEWLQRVVPTLLVVPMAQHYAMTAAELGVIFCVYYYVYALAQVPAGILLDVYGPRRVLFCAAILMTIGTGIFIATSHFLPLLFGRILIGLGSSVAFLACLKIAKIQLPNKYFPRMVGLSNSIGMLGALLGMAPLSHIGHAWGWQSMLWSTIVLSALSAILIFALIRLPAQGRAKAGQLLSSSLASMYRSVLRHRRLWLIGCYAGLMQVPIIAYSELWAVPFLHYFDHLTWVTAASVNQYVFWGILIGGPCFGLFIRGGRFQQLLTNVVHVMVMLSLMALFAFHWSIYVLDLFSFSLGFFTSFMLISYTWASECVATDLSASAIALVNMLGVVIAASGQLLVSLLLRHFGVDKEYKMAFEPILLSSLAAFILVQFLSRSSPSALHATSDSK